MMSPGKVFINQNAKIFNIFLGFKRKAVHFMLYHLVCASVEGTSKQDVSDDGLLHLCNSLQAPEVEQTVFSHDRTVIPSRQSWNSVSIAENTLLKSVGERTQPRFTPFVTGKGFRHQNLNHHAIVKLSNDRYELAGTAKILHYLLQDVSSYLIEGLGQINDGPKEVATLLLSIFLELEWGEYHVGSSTL